MNKISNFLWGLVFIGIGVIVGLNALEITNIDIFFDGFWTLFIIVPCFIGLFSNSGRQDNFIGLVIGILLLLGCRDLLEFELIFKLMVPFILVMIGLSFLFKDSIHSKVQKKIKHLNKTKNIDKDYCSTFGGQTVDFSNEDFDGCNLTAVFGEVKCELTDAKIKDESIVNASSIFGGIVIYVPKDVKVKIASTPIFGGVSDDRKKIDKSATKTIYINATCLFGGVEIK